MAIGALKTSPNFPPTPLPACGLAGTIARLLPLALALLLLGCETTHSARSRSGARDMYCSACAACGLRRMPGRLSVTRFSQRIWIAARGGGQPATAATSISSTSPALHDSR